MKEEPKKSILSDLHPVIAVGAAICAVVVWSYNTFAQLSYVKEQQSILMTLIEQRHNDALLHSDMNRDRMLNVMSEIRDSVRQLQFQMNPRSRDPREPSHR